MKRNTKLWKARKRNVAKAPNWLRTAAIAKPRKAKVSGTFGPASEVVRIDPETGEPMQAAREFKARKVA